MDKNPLTVKGVSNNLYDIRSDGILFKVNSSFIAKVDYDLEQYDRLVRAINDNRDCFKGSLSSCGIDARMEKDGDVVKFKVDGKKMVVFDSTKYILDNVNILFAYDFDENLIPDVSLI